MTAPRFAGRVRAGWRLPLPRGAGPGICGIDRADNTEVPSKMIKSWSHQNTTVGAHWWRARRPRPTRKIKAVGRPSLAATQSNYLKQVFLRALSLG